MSDLAVMVAKRPESGAVKASFRKQRLSRCRSYPVCCQRPARKSRTSSEGPFGEVIRVSGSQAGQNPFRFSTKFTDDESGLVYYGYRYYSPSMGRWISRDPIGEEGCLNLYAFAANASLANIDRLGLEVVGEPDLSNCTIPVRLKVKAIREKGRNRGGLFGWGRLPQWDDATWVDWQRRAKGEIETYYNKQKFRCLSPDPNCKCKDGLRVVVTVDYVDQGEDYRFHVRPDITRGTEDDRSFVNFDRTDAYLDANDPDSSATSYHSEKSGNFNVPVADMWQNTIDHEVGHLFGLDHPGQDLSPKAPPNEPADYDADRSSLMGRGMDLRSKDFNKAFCSKLGKSTSGKAWNVKASK